MPYPLPELIGGWWRHGASYFNQNPTLYVSRGAATRFDTHVIPMMVSRRNDTNDTHDTHHTHVRSMYKNWAFDLRSKNNFKVRTKLERGS